MGTAVFRANGSKPLAQRHQETGLLVVQVHGFQHHYNEFQALLPADQRPEERFSKESQGAASASASPYERFTGPYEHVRADLQRLRRDPNLTAEQDFPCVYAPVRVPGHSASAATPRQAMGVSALEGAVP
jgi:hypothetical protein